jgi:hypothetical protein
MRLSKWFVGLVIGAIALQFGQQQSINARSTSDGVSAQSTQRSIEQARRDAIRRDYLNLNNIRSHYITDRTPSRDFDQSIITESSTTGRQTASAAAVPPPPSPGLPMGQTSYDFQGFSTSNRRTARVGGANIVHFVWTDVPFIPGQMYEQDRWVSYSSYDLGGGTYIQPIGGVFVGLGTQARAGFPTADVWDDNTLQLIMHQRSDVSLPYEPWHLNFPVPGNSNHIDEALDGAGDLSCPEVLWPTHATSRDGSRSIHAVAHSNVNDCPTDLLWYWRYNGTMWTGPVVIDSTGQISYAVADDPSGDKVAVVVHLSNWSSMNGLNNVGYLESTTDGAGWIAGTEPKTKSVITNYGDEFGPSAWLDLTAAYDHAGILHIVYDEQLVTGMTAATAIKHWNSQRQTSRTVTIADWEPAELPGLFNLNLSGLSMGIGDGSTMCQGGAESNEDYVYILYHQYGGPTQAERDDHSNNGYYNAELYLSVSTDAGMTWSSPVNLTNTKTPNCNPGAADEISGIPQRPDSVCRSENWATLGLVVSDIDITFISDLDAGAVTQGEGTWQLNPVHYYRIPGGTTDAQHVCPLQSANFEAQLSLDPNCDGYYAFPGGQHVETLTIMNLGNADLTGDVSVTDFPGVATLTVSDPGPYTIPAGASNLAKTVTMSANGAPDGAYSGSITITHNAPGEPSPRVVPVELIVTNFHPCIQCNCPCWADPNCDGVRSDVQDVVGTIDAAFRGTAGITDPGCPVERTDVDADGSTNVGDVVRVINVAFRGQTVAVNYVNPCS